MSIENRTFVHFRHFRHFSSLLTIFPSTTVESTLQIRPFLTNKPNFRKVKLNVNKVLTKNYVQMDTWSILKGDYPHLWWEGIRVSMKLTPRTLNCRSQGNWVKAHLTLPQGFTVADVDSNRPAVLHSLGFESAPLYVFVNKDKLVQIEAAFERQVVCSLAGDWPQALTVAGFLTDGNIFLGRSKVQIIHAGLKLIRDLVSFRLQGDCV